MPTGRLEAFSDGVVAIIITIMVLKLHARHEPTLAGLRPLVPTLLAYVLSFVFVGIYWNNHHHLFQAADRLNGAALWANLHLLFWLSLVPLVTGWMGNTNFDRWPVAAYGVVLLMSGVAYSILAAVLIHVAGDANAVLAGATASHGEGQLSMLLYATAIPLTFVNRWIACALYVAVAVMWLVPDRRIERTLQESSSI